MDTYYSSNRNPNMNRRPVNQCGRCGNSRGGNDMRMMQESRGGNDMRMMQESRGRNDMRMMQESRGGNNRMKDSCGGSNRMQESCCGNSRMKDSCGESGRMQESCDENSRMQDSCCGNDMTQEVRSNRMEVQCICQVTDNCHHPDEMEQLGDCFPVVMAYVPWQQWGELYDPDCRLMQGTIFKDLNYIFCGSRC